MIYKFKSRASGDVVMMAEAGDEVLRIVGKSAAGKGIIEATAMPAAIASIEAAVAADEAVRARAAKEAGDASGGLKLPSRDGVALRQRVWPLVEMMKRSMAEDADIVWGV